MGDEELAAVGAGSCIGHRKDAGAIVLQGRVKFIGETITGVAHTCASRISALDHEVRDHTVEDGIVIESLAGQENKVIHSFWRLIRIKVAGDVAFICFEDSLVSFLWIDLHFRSFWPAHRSV